MFNTEDLKQEECMKLYCYILYVYDETIEDSCNLLYCIFTKR